MVLNCSAEVGIAIKAMHASFKTSNRESALHQCFKNNPYDISQIPLLENGVLDIWYTFDFVNLISLANDGTIVMIADLELSWVDEFRKWNSSELLGLESIYIPTQEIWTPEFVLSNCESDNCVYGANNQTRAKLFSDGVASLMLLRKKFVATCEIDLSTFPYDSQKCTLTFQVFFQLKNRARITSYNGTYLKDMVENDEWNFLYIYDSPTNITYWHYYRGEEGRYYLKERDGESFQIQGFIVEIALERRATYYETNLIVPVLIISVIGIFANFLGATSSDKINVQVTVFLGFLFLQSLTASIIPQSEITPKVALYILYALLISAFNVLYSSVLLMGKMKKGKKLPTFIEKIFVRFLGYLLKPWKLFSFLKLKRKSPNSSKKNSNKHDYPDTITNFHEERISAISKNKYERPVYFESFLDLSPTTVPVQLASNRQRDTVEVEDGNLETDKNSDLNNENMEEQTTRIWSEFLGNLNIILALLSITLSALDFWFYLLPIFE